MAERVAPSSIVRRRPIARSLARPPSFDRPPPLLSSLLPLTDTTTTPESRAVDPPKPPFAAKQQSRDANLVPSVRPSLNFSLPLLTSTNAGVRAVVVDAVGELQFDSSLRWAVPDDPDEWLRAAETLMRDVPVELRMRMSRICFSGTSASCLLVDAHDPTWVTRGPRMYGFNTLTETPEVALPALQMLEGIAPEKHTTLGGTSALMKLVCWHLENAIELGEVFCHQADYVSAHIRGARGPGSVVSDWNNALKAGFDVEQLAWPAWLLESGLGGGIRHSLPKVTMPGAVVGPVSTDMAYRFSLPQSCKVVAGTTDSIAAFIAANATTPGHAVTSLGSTLAVKMLSERRVEDASRGVYSHRLGHARSTGTQEDESDLWLVGGASNVGCAVLRAEGFEGFFAVGLAYAGEGGRGRGGGERGGEGGREGNGREGGSGRVGRREGAIGRDWDGYGRKKRGRGRGSEGGREGGTEGEGNE
eukprot:jgi/Undpi1/11164/HiC_scaffold_30.g13462.m1